MSKNKNLHKAKKAKNDEFYTRFEDIQNEMVHYKEHFKGKTIYLNCDDPQSSNFWQYFAQKFDDFGLKKLVATHYDAKEKTYKLEITRGIDLNNDGKYNEDDVVTTPLEGNGDFRNDESIKILKEADIVVTNPPFSLFREYIAQLIEYDKKFLIIGALTAVGYKEIFPYIKNEKIWLGVSNPKQYILSDGSFSKKFGNHVWFTNMNHYKRNEKFIPYKEFDEQYQKYDNKYAYDCSKYIDIPKKCDKIFGVPLSFLQKINPEQFEIVGFRKGDDGKDLRVNGKDKFTRILIKWK